MKFSIYTAVVALAAFAAAETVVEDVNVLEKRGNPPQCDKAAKKIPKCARAPITKCTKKAGCGGRDYACGCKHKKQITNCATNPVLAKCGTKKGLQARKAAAQLCNCVKKNN